jgi:choline dehydrogenase-like flavoprotein
MPDLPEAADVLIVGGGSAGTVLAARLSEDPARTVLLLEAGHVYPPGAEPAALLDPARLADPGHDWGYTSRGNDWKPQLPTPRGRVLGGSSAVNAGVATRARPADLAKWGRHGVDGWSFAEVLPAFKRLENTPTGDDAYHGRTGPLPVRQRTDAELTPALRGFVNATVALAAGTYGSASILLRSGVGPAGDLRPVGIEVVADLPVGERLQDHPFFHNAYALAPAYLEMSPAIGSMLWTASSEAGGDELDLQITVSHLLDPSYSPTGGAVVLATSVVQPESHGTLKLASRDPGAAPLIDNDFLSTGRDARRMLEGVKLARAIARNPVFAPFTAGEPTPGDTGPDEGLAEVIAANLAIYGHPTTTAPMGGPADEWAVVDAVGAVHGLSGLRVADASIIPDIPSTPTNLTVIMLASASTSASTRPVPEREGRPWTTRRSSGRRTRSPRTRTSKAGSRPSPRTGRSPTSRSASPTAAGTAPSPWRTTRGRSPTCIASSTGSTRAVTSSSSNWRCRAPTTAR